MNVKNFKKNLKKFYHHIYYNIWIYLFLSCHKLNFYALIKVDSKSIIV